MTALLSSHKQREEGWAGGEGEEEIWTEARVSDSLNNGWEGRLEKQRR